jgi:phosphate starvation-inducible PhoH-like protein
MSSKKRSSNNKSQSPTDKSLVVHQNEKIRRPLEIKQRPDLTSKQKDFLKLALDNNIKVIFLSGPAGSSKSFLSVLASLELLNLKKVSDIIYVRSIVESSDNKMGFLPGDASEKLSPYLEPLVEKLEEMLDKSDINNLQKENRIQGKPTGYLRGLSWNAKAIILDEAQNMTFAELVTAMTRIGHFSKMFICGDPMQSDINGKTGFALMCSLFNNEKSKERGIHSFYLANEDIVRSEIVKYIVEIVEEYKRTLPIKK